MNRCRMFQSIPSHGKFKWCFSGLARIFTCLLLFIYFCFTSCSSCWGNHAIWQPRWQSSSKQRSVTVIAWYSEAMQPWCVCVWVCTRRWINAGIVAARLSQTIVWIWFDAGVLFSQQRVQGVRDVGVCGGVADKLASHQFDGRICGEKAVRRAQAASERKLSFVKDSFPPKEGTFV